MEMTPIDPRDKNVSLGDGATPHGRDLSSSSIKNPNIKEEGTHKLDPSDIVKHEYPVDTAANSIAKMLRLADPRMDAETANRLAKLLLGRDQMKATPLPEESVGTQLDVSA